MRRDGVFYLLTLRLVPVFPFFLVKLLAGLTPIGAARFYWVNQLGLLAGTVVYVNAGTQLAAIQRPAAVLWPGLLASFVLLGVFPLIANRIVQALKRRQVYAGWTRPKRFDRNLVVIGAGAGRLVTAYIGAAVKAKVTQVEGHKTGGDCLNFGCVPSKALMRSAKLARQIDKAESLGLRDASARINFTAVMARVQRVIGDIAPHDSVARYSELCVDVVQGHARISPPRSVEINGADGQRQTLTTRSIVIAVGAQAFVPPIPGLAEVGCLTSDTVWGLNECPRRRRHGAWFREGAQRAGQGQDPRRDHRRGACRRLARRIRSGDETRPGAEQDPRRDPHLPHSGRGQPVRGRRMHARACPAAAAGLG